jgi:hypothetical protein
VESNEASVAIRYVPKEAVYALWPFLYKGVVTYNAKSPHQTASPEAVLLDLTSPGGDELLVITQEGEYAGFLTYKEIELEGERCGAIAMIFADEVLAAAMPAIKSHFQQLGCTRISFFTARRGFIKAAPRLGFRPRIIEWTMEVG